MKISVNTRHIRTGTGSDSNSCAIALAVREGVEAALAKEAKNCKLVGLTSDIKTKLPTNAIDVDGTLITVGSAIPNKDAKSMRTRGRIAKFISNFDRLKELQSQSFLDDSDKSELAHLKRVVKPFSFELRLS